MASKFYANLKQEAIFWLARRLPTCQHYYVPLFSESMDRQLTLRERVSMRLHFLYCDPCLNYLRQLRFMRDVLRLQAARTSAGDAAANGPTSPGLPDDARDRIKDALRKNLNR
jgi:hypothetical protein